MDQKNSSFGEAEKKLRESEHLYHTILDSMAESIHIIDRDFCIVFVNKQFSLGLKDRGIDLDVTGMNLQEAFPFLTEKVYKEYRTVFEMLETSVVDDMAVIGDKEYFSVVQKIPIMEEGRAVKVVTIIRDITETKKAQGILASERNKLQSILDNIEIGVVLISPEMKILEMNQRMRKWFSDVDPSQAPVCYCVFNDPSCDACRDCPTVKTLKDGLVHEALVQRRQKNALSNYRILSSPVRNAAGKIIAAIEIVEDITEKLSLESQLLQAQKMESVGRLAGGVAHDFNNMLAVILGYTQLIMENTDLSQPLLNSLVQIQKAAERSSDLTRQLLAFARKQPIAPRVLDLNETVEGMLKILRRLIGEDISLEWMPGKNIWPINVDPSQIDQILANLCINAKDAITGPGRIVIETQKAVFDKNYCEKHAACTPGEYTLLTVSDNGSGMDNETMAKLFEPFFTTKELGKGTGLGLATVYGIVKQNNGFINVYSELGFGTIFKIYLPRHKNAVVLEQKASPPGLAMGNETVLLVDDEKAILDMAEIMLQQLGYTVIAASTPAEAIKMVGSHDDIIHLLVTDVVMPGMTGHELAQNLTLLYPDMKLLFMSGYSADVIAPHGVLDQGIHFIQKPFSLRNISVKVREALEGKVEKN
jgi:two-component system, cell cycle sensor histidine kinase and response regulator CckA